MTKNPSYKRPYDLSVLAVTHLFPLLIPLWLLLWVLIPLLIWLEDRGPIFFKQRRVGKNNTPFTFLKFRTMSVDSDSAGLVTADQDPRITKVGRLLRRTALDELPQVINILRGDMSFVGPRPLDEREPSLLEKKIAGFEERLLVAPGLTGLAQVYDQEDLAKAKLNYDLDYIQRMNPFLDLKLLVLSVRNTLLARWDRRGGKENMTHDD